MGEFGEIHVFSACSRKVCWVLLPQPDATVREIWSGACAAKLGYHVPSVAMRRECFWGRIADSLSSELAFQVHSADAKEPAMAEHETILQVEIWN